MSGQTESTGRKTLRCLTWTCLVAVPALAVAAAGPALSTTLTSDRSAADRDGLLVPETRVFSAPSVRPADRTGDELKNAWQNTRDPFFPPARSPYSPPGRGADPLPLS